jgi:hypothetical protein
MNHPNPRNHQIISFIKSSARLVGYIAILINIPVAVSILVASEILGIVEELV